ncbi:hypothetical protein Tco_1092810 [Tanacetum coccineum]|uniref:Uncharacterized protein n=1 Tax=Tanacetum coccineum TaxID=301880 RepID=A0ABQ5IAW8_9ASTR
MILGRCCCRPLSEIDIYYPFYPFQPRAGCYVSDVVGWDIRVDGGGGVLGDTLASSARSFGGELPELTRRLRTVDLSRGGVPLLPALIGTAPTDYLGRAAGTVEFPRVLSLLGRVKFCLYP